MIKYLCNQHENIKFTFECETKDGLPFLDTRVKRKKSTLVTVLYHKKTFTGTYLNWNSLTDRKYKVGLIYCLMDRIWKICPEQETRELEVSKLKVILAKNDYPSAIIEKEINKFLKNRQSQISVTADTEPTRANNNNVKYIVLPHVNNKVIEFGKRLKKFVENNFIDVELKVVFVAPMEIRNLFKLKDKLTDKYMQSRVVYRIDCSEPNCNSFYIGKCDRIFGLRVKDHRRKSTSKTPNKNAPYIHSEQTGHVIDYDGVKIIDRADSGLKLGIKETLHIIQSKPNLNTLCTNEFDLKTLMF